MATHLEVVPHSGVQVIEQDPIKAMRYYFTIQSFLLSIKEKMMDELYDGYWAMNMQVHGFRSILLWILGYGAMYMLALTGCINGIVWIIPVFIACCHCIVAMFVDPRDNLVTSAYETGLIISLTHVGFVIYGKFYAPPIIYSIFDILPMLLLMSALTTTVLWDSERYNILRVNVIYLCSLLMFFIVFMQAVNPDFENRSFALVKWDQCRLKSPKEAYLLQQATWMCLTLANTLMSALSYRRSVMSREMLANMDYL